jgi:hypothetical protein
MTPQRQSLTIGELPKHEIIFWIQFNPPSTLHSPSSLFNHRPKHGVAILGELHAASSGSRAEAQSSEQ